MRRNMDTGDMRILTAGNTADTAVAGAAAMSNQKVFSSELTRMSFMRSLVYTATECYGRILFVEFFKQNCVALYFFCCAIYFYTALLCIDWLTLKCSPADKENLNE